MKQKVIIGFSLALLLFAVYLIAHDLFRRTPSHAVACCGDEEPSFKNFDSTLLGYTRITVIETGLHDLSGIAVNEQQQIFVCGNKQVVVYNHTGERTAGFSIDSMANCIAWYNNNLYIGEGPRVACYSMEGNLKSIWKPFNLQGCITSVAATGDYVYAADAMNKRILKYTPDGHLVQEIGRKDSVTGAPGFIIPSLYFDVASGGYHDIWVVDPGRLRLEDYSASGILQSSWGKASFEDNGFTGCCNPAHMALLPNNSFVTYEKGIDKIKVFDPTGTFVCMVAGAGSFKGKTDFQLGRINLVKDLATDNTGNIYVLDAYNRINIFRKKA